MSIVEVPVPLKTTCEPGGNLINNNEDKYILNTGSFALTINSPNVADNGKYECRLRVRDPSSPTGGTYDFPRGRILTLTVDGE